MKSVCSPRCYLLLAGLVLALTAGQTALAQPADTPETKYWIFLSDKLDAAGKTTTIEAGHLTERARQRRLRRGTMRSSTTDAPLSPAYLNALGTLGITPLHQSRWLNAVSARLTARQAEATRALPFVRALRPVARLTAVPEPAPSAALSAIDPPAARKNTSIDYGQSLAQLELINAVQPLERGINGEGVLIGFLDTRYDLVTGQHFDHRALRHIPNSGRLLEVRDFTTADQAANGANQTSRHGMSVASVAVGFEEGQMVGPAYGAQVLAATTEFGPFERNVEEDNFVRGLEWLESQGVDVVNTSLGYSEFDAGQHSYTPADLDGDTGITTVAFDLAASLGVVVVGSAGNEGNAPWRFITTPADGDSVIAVGSVDNLGTRNAFSGVGPTADGRIKPDVAAQGSTVFLASSNGAYNSNGAGTSFSSPMVAAVAAQILQVNPNLNPIEVRDILRETASQAANPDNLLGWGIIDADAAILRAESLVTATEDEAPLPTAFEIRAPYPNPFTDETVFEVRAPAQAGFARMSIYNLLGQRVDVPFEGALNPGVNTIVFRAASLPAGLYLYRLEGDGVSRTGKMVLMR